MVKGFCDPSTFKCSVGCPPFVKSFRQMCRSVCKLPSFQHSPLVSSTVYRFLVGSQSGTVCDTASHLIEDSGL